MQRIYLDNNATTPLDPRVAKAITDELLMGPSNPSSIHWFGQQAKNRLIGARSTVAKFFQVDPDEVIFTSGGTESINIFLRSLPKGSHVITSTIEHAAVLETLKALDLEVSYLPVSAYGSVDPKTLENALREDTKAVILSAANSETGVMLDIDAITAILNRKNIPLMLDAVGIIGKEPFHFSKAVTAAAISGHKFHGPKGSGVLLLRKRYKLQTIMTGGGQEHNQRSGTENLAAIVGLAKAIEILSNEQSAITQKLKTLRDYLERRLLEEFQGAAINGEGPRISNTSNLFFPEIDGETLLMQLDLSGIAVSHGSACSAGSIEPSRVLINMGYSRQRAKSSIRISLSRMNTKEEIDLFIEKVKQQIFALSPR